MPHLRHTRWLRSASLAIVAVLALAAPAMAAHEPPRLGLAPIGSASQYFDLVMEPGESLDLQVELANFGHEELLARTFAADAYTIINGGFAAELSGESMSGTTLWLDYPAQERGLLPDEGVVIDFTVSVPDDAQPGDYITALVAQNVQPYRGADQGGVAIQQVNRTVVAVAIDVPGPRMPEFAIGPVSHKAAAGSSFVSFAITNTGNAHLKPAGSFLLRDADGVQIATAEPVMDSLYAGNMTLLETPQTPELAPGAYCAELSLIDEASGAGASTECLPFTVDAPVLADASDASQAIPLVSPLIDAVSDNAPRAALVAVGMTVSLVGGYILIARRSRRRAGDALETGSHKALVDAIAHLPGLLRAWLIRHDSYLELAIEGFPGINVDLGAQMARTLQRTVGNEIDGVPLRAVFLGGARVVARHTAGRAPIYRAAGPHTGR